MAMDQSPAMDAAPAKSSQPLPLASREDDDRRWKRLTEQANAAYAQGDIPLARAAYDDALTEAERLFEAAIGRTSSLPVPVIYNISCHNLAELAERLGSAHEAEDYYRKAYDRLLEAALSPVVPLEMRMACVQHLKHALAVLVQHIKSGQETEARIGDIIRRAHDAAYTVHRVARHAAQADADCPHCPIFAS